MNVELLEKVIEHIEEEPSRFDMDHWHLTVDPDKDLGAPPCGTVACIAGWACVLSGMEAPSGDYDQWEARAKEVLDLPYRTATTLFFVGSWPYPFRHAYQAARTQEERIEAAVKRIRHFIETDGTDEPYPDYV